MQKLQLPPKYKKIGLVLMAIGLAGMISNVLGFEPAWMNWSVVSLWHRGQPNTLTLIDHNMYARVCGMFYIVGSAFVVLSREKKDPEKYNLIWFGSVLHASVGGMVLFFIGRWTIPNFTTTVEYLVAANMAVPVIFLILYSIRKRKMLKEEKEQAMVLEQLG